MYIYISNTIILSRERFAYIFYLVTRLASFGASSMQDFYVYNIGKHHQTARFMRVAVNMSI